MKPRVSLLFYLAAVCMLITACNENETADDTELTYVFGGPAQGTTYQVKYHGAGLQDHQQSVDSILKVIDLSLSTYVKESTVSRFNRQNELVTRDQHFIRMVFDSRDLRDMSEGAFDPAVMPLVKAWGFGPEGPEVRGNQSIDSLLKLVDWGFETKISNETEGGIHRTTTLEIVKKRPISFDFNGIAQGYTVDVIVEFLKSKGVKNAMVEVGGEIRAIGQSDSDKPWLIGIDQPNEQGERGSQAQLKLTNRAVATSGNYRKYYEKDGKRYSHTIDPRTGYPVDHQMLSATVVASSAALADAYATVLMVYGPYQSVEFLESEKGDGLEAYLIFVNEAGEVETYISDGLKDLLNEL